MNDPDRLVLSADPRLEAVVRALANLRMVFFAGLPGTGKSLLVHQLSHVARGRARIVHLLQWDVARPVFEATPAGRRYPLDDGVTHPLIRKAAGRWSRQAIAAWDERHSDPVHLLIGETPLVGNRFVELARPAGDRVEPLLRGEACRFVLPVPSVEVRQYLEAERERRASAPLHEREREDAPPHVLRALWAEIAEVARQMDGQPAPAAASGRRERVATAPYDRAVYRRVYAAVLRHRRAEVIEIRTILPTRTLSVYDFGTAPQPLVPTPDEAEDAIREVERRYRDPAALERDVARWWAV